MKPVSKSSYDEDDREFLGEFFEKKVKKAKKEEKKEDEELFKLDELVKEKYIKLDISEENSLYNIAGYIAKQISKAKVCDTCYKAILCRDQEEVKPFNTLLKLKEYKEGALVAVNLQCFKFFEKMESFFRSAKIIFKKMPKLKKFLDQTAQKRIGDAGSPKCHKIQEKLLTRFITFRLRIYAQFCSPKNLEFDFSSKSGNAKTLAKQVGGSQKKKSAIQPSAKAGAKRRKVTRTQAPPKQPRKRANQSHLARTK